MPVRATKRGAERTPFPSGASYDVVICGASFAGLAVARELRASRARVLVLDRYEIGEKQTSACCAPTEWIVNLGLEGSIRQTFDSMVLHTMGASVRWQIPYTFSTFDYRELCELMWAQCGDAEFETAKVDGRTGDVVHTDRGDVRGELIVDALGWRRVLGKRDDPAARGDALARPGGPPARLRPRPAAVGRPALRARRATAGRSPPASELRIGIGSYDPRFHVKEPTVRLAAGRGRRHRPLPGQLDPAPLPRPRRGRRVLLRRLRRALPGDERRGDPHGLVLRDRRRARAGRGARGRAHARARRSRATPRSPRRTAGSSSGCGSTSARVRHLHGRPLDGLARFTSRPRLIRWLFRKYLNVAPPSFALPAPPQAQPALALAA